MSPKSILILRLSAIGDCCNALPVVRTLQATYPEAQISWVIGTTEHSLLEGADGIEFITLDKSRGIGGLLDLRNKLGGRRYDILLHMNASMRANLASMVINARRRVGFDKARARDYQWLFTTERIPAQANQHVVDGLFGFVEYLGISERTMRWDIPVSETDQQSATRLATKDVPICVISPCSSQRARNFRNWGIQRYIQLVSYLQETFGARVILTGAATPVEKNYGHQIVKACGADVSNLVGRTRLKELLAIIERADLLICPDSGPAHMATAVGTPVIGLYATSNRWRTGPYLSQHLVVDRYPEAVQAEFAKPVSELRWGQRVRDPAAMDLVAVDDVKAKVDEALGGGSTS
ncbi:MAG: glycosyl transferase [Chromatiales bacterium]|nr:glycosyl transferase [Chromatiales bacterium]MDP6151308.1 glycosyltransferase family 9 protein [Gammaproteobacteria bacterium]MDP7093677.1 glycosyltransferase family 9 protein [Gammaproteobacteria bacterium]MDP7270300.1 glycosyltransferase family 9 protein [Gammaproteobacteria bacterium]HJP05262.1 glycosyltransferase family 9 protein [Gammaproteobacteria bacterium]